MQQLIMANKLIDTEIFSDQLLVIKVKKNLFVVHVVMVMMVVQIQDLISAVPLSIQDQILEEDVTLRTGQDLQKILTDTTEFLRINAKKHTVGNLTIFQALINVSMEIMKLSFVHDYHPIVINLNYLSLSIPTLNIKSFFS